MSQDVWIAGCYGFLLLSGGIIARAKGDYFSRGMGIALLTGFFGILALIFSPPSKARANNLHDIHNWPLHAQFAVFGQLLFVLLLLIVY